MILFTGNESGLNRDEIDYYASYSYPNYAKVQQYTEWFILNITIVQDNKFEDNESIQIVAIPHELPDNYTYHTTIVSIIDDDRKFADLYTYSISYSYVFYLLSLQE